MNHLIEQVSWAHTYVTVVRYAGKKAKATGDPVWVGLYIAGVGVGVAWVGVGVWREVRR